MWFTRLRQRGALLLPDELNVRLRDVTVCVHIIAEVLLTAFCPLCICASLVSRRLTTRSPLTSPKSKPRPTEAESKTLP